MHGSFWVWAQPMRGGLIMQRLLSLAEPWGGLWYGCSMFWLNTAAPVQGSIKIFININSLKEAISLKWGPNELWHMYMMLHSASNSDGQLLSWGLQMPWYHGDCYMDGIHHSWWHGGMETRSAFPGGFSQTKGTVIWNFGVFFNISLGKLLNKLSSHWWFETPWCWMPL